MKGDSAELFTTVLKYIHGCYIESKQRFEAPAGADDLDIMCAHNCIAHQLLNLKLVVKVSCQCHYVKEVQNYYINNFSHVVNGAEFIEDLSDGMKTGGSMKFKDMWEALKPTMQYDKSCDKPGCQYKNSKIETFILDPLPQIFVLNFNWGNPELSAKELLRVYMSFRDNVTMSLFYQMSPETKKAEPEYSLTSFICF